MRVLIFNGLLLLNSLTSVMSPPRPPANAGQLILVTTKGWNAVEGALQRYERDATGASWRSTGEKIPIVVGRNGLAWGKGLQGEAAPPGSDGPVKKEGDGRAPAGALDATVVAMRTLNRAAADALRPFAPNAVTDVTGFGLLGHAYEMASRSDVRIELDASSLPALPGAFELASAGTRTGGARCNRDYTGPHVESTAPARQLPRSLNSRTMSPLAMPRGAASFGWIRTGSRPRTFEAWLNAPMSS